MKCPSSSHSSLLKCFLKEAHGAIPFVEMQFEMCIEGIINEEIYFGNGT
jgi:hypothetical protein